MKPDISHIRLFLLGCTCCTLFLSCRHAENVATGNLHFMNLLLTAPNQYTREWQTSRLVVSSSDTLSLETRGRGHSTFAQPKHPYSLRFSSKHPLASLPPHHHFVLLANFFDHSLMRNALAMEVSRQTSLKPLTPQWRFISLNVDGKWQGVCWLSERVKDLVEKGDSLLKMDVYEWASQREKGLPPDTLPQGMQLDTISFADWWLVHELCMNAEPNGPRSCYAIITADRRLKAGPAWDFDMAFNEVGIDNGGDLRPQKFKGMATLPPFLHGKTIRWLTIDSLYCPNSFMVKKLLKDRHFQSIVKKRWHTLLPRFKRLIPFIDKTAKTLASQASADQERWNKLEPARFDDATTWTQAVDKLRNTYKQRLESLNHLIENLGNQ